MNLPLTPRQTRSFLMKRFAEVGIQPKTKYGQNFLIDLNLLRVLRDAAQIDRNDVVLEVGGGTGALTGMLAEQAAHVVSVEIDPQMEQLARESLVPFQNVTLLRQDALRNKNTIHPAVLETVAAHLAAEPGRRVKLAANLPYNIATPLISSLLLSEPLVHSITVTIQKELADRIIASPGSKDYGALSIWTQSQCETEIVRVMPPTVFWPRPKVDSAIIKLTLVPELRERIADLSFFQKFTRAMFFHRRKFLRSELVSALKSQLTKSDVDHLMDLLGYPGDIRSEQLSVQQMIELADVFRQATDQGEPSLPEPEEPEPQQPEPQQPEPDAPPSAGGVERT